ncbi:hypothetical protein [Myroides odoratimimus]|uniref:Uncharacterized protein n=1 Tax=Myroides odoratimimus CIP 101113 TaxID=883154 RepID=A0AAV3F6L3_9FLAO|nr:hypothetical protein [Myroides odoratimimus]EHO14584.1 hypothetical protein HMPREF9715_00469 [Myroides odoratimimus CIP 101113]SHM69647.1 hypothetical protein SAMN05444275_12113 [Myroides odoratimimus subsp. xuanwuensis]
MKSILSEVIVGLVPFVFTIIIFFIKRYFKNKDIVKIEIRKLNSKEELRKKRLLDQKYINNVLEYNNCEVDYYERYRIRTIFKNIPKYECMSEKLDLADRGILEITTNRITFSKKKVKVRLNKVMEIYVQYVLLIITFIIFIYTVLTFIPIIIKTPSFWMKLFFLCVLLLPGVTVNIILRYLVEPEQARILKVKLQKLSKKDHLEIVGANWENFSESSNKKESNKKSKKRKNK